MMFSNDKNVETIGQLIEVLKHYIGLQSEYLKLDVVDKVVRLLTCHHHDGGTSGFTYAYPHLPILWLLLSHWQT